MCKRRLNEKPIVVRIVECGIISNPHARLGQQKVCCHSLKHRKAQTPGNWYTDWDYNKAKRCEPRHTVVLGVLPRAESLTATVSGCIAPCSGSLS